MHGHAAASSGMRPRLHLVPRRARATGVGRVLSRVLARWRSTLAIAWLLAAVLRRLLSVSTLLWPTRRRSRRCSVVLLTTVALLLRRRTSVSTRLRPTVSSLLRVASLLVLRVVAWINCTEDELEDPEIGGEVDGRASTSHLGGLVLVVGCAIDHASDAWVVVELSKELSSLLVVSDLRKLERHRAGAQVRSLTDSVANGILESSGGFASRLAVCNGDDQHRLAGLAQLRQDNRIDDLLAQLRAERGETYDC